MFEILEQLPFTGEKPHAHDIKFCGKGNIEINKMINHKKIIYTPTKRSNAQHLVEY